MLFSPKNLAPLTCLEVIYFILASQHNFLPHHYVFWFRPCINLFFTDGEARQICHVLSIRFIFQKHLSFLQPDFIYEIAFIIIFTEACGDQKWFEYPSRAGRLGFDSLAESDQKTLKVGIHNLPT